MRDPLNSSGFRDATQNLSFIYFIALAVIAVAAVISQVLIQVQLDNQKDSARLINVAGRQRMLSQKISKLGLEAQAMTRTTFRVSRLQQLEQELESALFLWQKSHEALRKGDGSLEVSAHNTPEIEDLFQLLTPHYDAINGATKGVLLALGGKGGVNQSLLDSGTQIILRHEADFLKHMNKIVFQYDRDATEEVKSLRFMEVLLFGVTIIVLVIELFVVFLPQAKRLRLSYHELKSANETTTRLAAETEELYQNLQASDREIKHIHHALNEATIIVKTNYKGYIIEVNDNYCEVSEYSRADSIGVRFNIPPFVKEEFNLPTVQARSSDELIWRGETLLIRKDDTNYWLDITLIPIANSSGETFQFLAICTDISLRKAQERQRIQENQENYEREMQEQRLRSFAIITGQEKERKRMSREVHDGLGQVLTALNFRLESLQVTNEKEEQKLTETKQLLGNAILEVRRISSGLLPSVLNDYGLSAGIKELVQIFSKDTAISITYHNNLKLAKRLHRDIEVSLYRIAQEALNNTLKYADASTVQVILSNDAEFISMTISDDGIGFDIEQIIQEPREDFSGNGLASMKERTNLIGGQFTITTTPNQGTIVEVEIPLIRENYE